MHILVLTALLAKALQSHCPQQLSPPPCLQGWSLALADMLAMTLQNPEDHPSAWSSFKLTSRMGTSSEPIIKGRAFQTAVLCTRCKYFRTINLRCFNKITVEKFLWIFAVSWANTKFLKPCTLKTGFFASLNYPVHALNSKQWITWLHCKKKRNQLHKATWEHVRDSCPVYLATTTHWKPSDHLWGDSPACIKSMEVPYYNFEVHL